MQKQYEGIHEIRVITKKEDLTPAAVSEFQPDYIFLPHWSYLLSGEITNNWNCVVFHMTDLPYGRGGSPLQNLIVRGHKDTKISAIQVTPRLDDGPVYMKEALSLEGSAQEIFERCSEIIFTKMIPVFLKQELIPVPQEGEPVVFKRRKPEEGRITEDMPLDAEGYPRAYMDFGPYRLEFEQVQTTSGGESLEAKVKIHIREE